MCERPPRAVATLNSSDDDAERSFLQPVFNGASHNSHYKAAQVKKRVLGQKSHIQRDGRVDIHVKEQDPEIAKLFNLLQCTTSPKEITSRSEGNEFSLRLNIVIQVIGSRGDIQPFIALGKELKNVGHRVRFATHLTFRSVVLEEGLEFFSIGGNPTELMAFMVKNSGLVPKLDTLRRGSILKQRRDMRRVIDRCWHSCFETGDGTHTHQIKDDLLNDKMDYRRRPFVADAIIANPPSLAHIHCAQRLGIPLHIMFTMPWSPTHWFPHPLAITHPQECERSVANYLSYAIVELMIWEGLGDLVNKFRKTCLTLEPLDTITGSSVIHRLRVPCTYFWSPALLPKPPDWPDYIDVCGFIFHPSKSNYKPPQEIIDFLSAGKKPIYVGFGSIVVDNPIQLLRTIFKAINCVGQRAIISRGWAGLGAEEMDLPDNVLIIGDIPHDWLFQHVSCVIHHGGAGTTAAGLAHGCPTIIVPFFGDQYFWGSAVSRAGAGPAPIPFKNLTSQTLMECIKVALQAHIRQGAQKIQNQMHEESGTSDGVRSFHRHINIRIMQCDICPKRPAVWYVKHMNLRLSAFAGAVLIESGKLRPQDLVLYRSVEYNTFRNPIEPVGAAAQILLGFFASLVAGIADIPGATVSCLFSLRSGISNPHEYFDPYIQCQQRSRKKRIIKELRMSTNKQSSRSHNKKRVRGHLLAILCGAALKRSLRITGKKSRNNNRRLWGIHQMGSETAFILSIISKKALRVIIKLPADLSLTLSKGFHNAPSLYGDHLVKACPQVTDLQTGFKAAGKELREGLHDGITGLYSQPLDSFKHGGVRRVPHGLAKGLSGAILKPLAGFIGLVGYPLNGLRQEINNSLRKPVEAYLEASRMEQGREEMHICSAEERIEVVEKWISIEELHGQDHKRGQKRSMVKVPRLGSRERRVN